MLTRTFMEKTAEQWDKLTSEEKQKRNLQSRIKMYQQDVYILERNQGSGSSIVLLKSEITKCQEYLGGLS